MKSIKLSPGRRLHNKPFQDAGKHFTDSMLDLALSDWCDMLKRMHACQEVCGFRNLYDPSRYQSRSLRHCLPGERSYQYNISVWTVLSEGRLHILGSQIMQGVHLFISK